MPFKPPAAKPKSPAELAAERTLAEAEDAIRLDRDPEASGIPPENVVFIEDNKPSIISTSEYIRRRKEARAHTTAQEEKSALLERLSQRL